MRGLSLPGPLHIYVEGKIEAGVEVLPVEWPHAAAVAEMPFRHRDPFDRLIIARFAQLQRV